MAGKMALKLKKGDLGTRPTLSKVRQALFNILAGRIADSVFVDLYAGTGAIGMEAMSRGAKAVYFVEADKKLASGLRDLLEGCGCRPKARVLALRAESFIRKSGPDKEGPLMADIVFLDPPYASGELEKVLPLLSARGFLSGDAVVIAEHASRSAPPDEAGALRKKRTYRYGDTSLTLYGRQKP
ncbi:MAG: 16S rRNA (guanine(966)-N(2))-methyltransferase RsmD [Nitrospiraceae bacterium]|nr:16S rRNA (guanine(966)-N(2))-methyltransferase RsmD [Nitrospiraceae bacterium]